MDFNIIYLIIPFLFYSLQFAILTKYSRNEGSMQIAFYRQLGIVLVGIPLFYWFPLDFTVLYDNLFYILLTSIIGAIFLFLNFKSLDFIPVAISTVFQTVSRILLTILVGVLLLGDIVNLYESIGILLLLIGVFTLLSKDKFNFKGIFLSIVGGILLVANWYYFVLYSKNFSPIIAGYLLEFFNAVFLIFLLIGKSINEKKGIKKSFKIKLRTFWIIVISSPLPLIGSIAISKSYEVYSFTIVGIMLTMTLPASMIFGYLLLNEKLSRRSIISIILITLSIVLIKIFS